MRKEKKQDTSDLGRKAIKEEEKKQVVETKTEPEVEAGTGAEAEAKADPETETEMGTENNKLEEKEKKMGQRKVTRRRRGPRSLTRQRVARTCLQCMKYIFSHYYPVLFNFYFVKTMKLH